MNGPLHCLKGFAGIIGVTQILCQISPFALAAGTVITQQCRAPIFTAGVG